MLTYLRVTSDFISKSWSQLSTWLAARSMFCFDSSLSAKPTKSCFMLKRRRSCTVYSLRMCAWGEYRRGTDRDRFKKSRHW